MCLFGFRIDIYNIWLFREKLFKQKMFKILSVSKGLLVEV